MKFFVFLTFVFEALFIPYFYIYGQQSSIKEKKNSLQLRFIRAYGADDETKAPILVLENSKSPYNAKFGGKSITIEFDIATDVPPSMYAKFIHCSADWLESENEYLNDFSNLMTSNIDWESAPTGQNYYGYRGKLKIPNSQVSFTYAGNWKVKLYDYSNDSVEFAETRFFVVNPKVDCQMSFSSEFYNTKFPIANAALNIESVVSTDQILMESNLSTVVIYKNHRWFEPYPISNSENNHFSLSQFRYKFPIMINGFLSVGKRFRIDRLPSEIGYRIIDLTDVASFPQINSSVRLPFADIRRRGSFDDYDDDGAMITKNIITSYDGYILLEFVMEPDNWYTKDNIYVVGSFNNWIADENWKMQYDEKDRYYKLRQWVRRGRHNYLYATGTTNTDTHKPQMLSYDEYEGNTSAAAHTYLCFVYYHETDYGGFDSIIGLGAATINGNINR